MTTATETQAEKRAQEALNFLGQRARHRNHEYPARCTGRSSDALALYGIGQGPRPYTVGRSEDGHTGYWTGAECDSNAPLDEADLLACTITYLMAPKWAQEVMLPVLTEFQNYVWYGLNRYGEKVHKGYRDASSSS